MSLEEQVDLTGCDLPLRYYIDMLETFYLGHQHD